MTCGTNLCASKSAPATAANRVPLPTRRESWLTSVTISVSSPVSLALVISASRLIFATDFHDGLRIGTLWLHHDRRDILIAHELVKCRHFGPHDLRQLLQLRIDLRNDFIVDRVRLRCRRSFSTSYNSTECRQLIVEPDRKVQR